MNDTKKDTWQKILHIIITILTALLTSLTAQSCIKHKSKMPLPQPEATEVTGHVNTLTG